MEWIGTLTDEEARILGFHWPFWARPDQIAPNGDWLCWLVQAGRGWGKTRTGAEWVNQMAVDFPGCRIALVAQTAADARDVMIEGESGILNCGDPEETPEYEPSKRRLTWPNGSMASTYSAEKSRQLRGPQHHFAWCDELASWSSWEAWTQLKMGLRLGDRPRCIITTTPRPLIQLRRLAEKPGTITTRGRTKDNKTNLSASFIQAIYDEYGSTTLGRQELEGELLSEIPGALFTRKLIDAHRVSDAPNFDRVVVAVDPAVTSNEDSDESGIVVAGVHNREFYVLADYSFIGSPDAVCRKAAQAYKRHQADRVIFEANQGGDTWRTILNGIDAHVATKNVHASRGKYARAEPVAARYEQGRVHHVGLFDELEDQLCNYVPGITKQSPDRLDALVWAVTELDMRTTPDISLDLSDNFVPNGWF